MIYYAHIKESGEVQTVAEHLEGTAKRSEKFASAFHEARRGALLGMAHDIGKSSLAFQRRLNGGPKVDHATAGALECLQIRENLAGCCVAGHHGGLPNFGNPTDTAGEQTFIGRCKKGKQGIPAYEWDGTLESGIPMPQLKDGFAQALWVRMLYSCLVDADYLDTEDYMSEGSVQRGGGDSPAEMLEKLKRAVAPWRQGGASSALNEKRTEILERCLRGAEDAPGLYTLTIPTGGGKTISSLAFALSHAAKTGRRRVIYVVPYTSIIEQNADVFRGIVGAENVLEHHANADMDGDEGSKARLASENWDAPVIVTTAVQFFESLFAARTSRCRKLHHIASSVVIFDEAQMLPMPYLKPCVDAIAELVEHYRVTAVLCTATQPSLGRLIASYAPGLPCREIAQDVDGLYDFFRRTRIEMAGELEEETLAQALGREQQVLCIVNARKRAQAIDALLPEEGRFHLSTLMTPEHRRRVLQQIRERLAAGMTCRVVSTSLVEAGVDLDFPTVWREACGLDSILQAAGRCNREGKREAQESVVHVFRFAGKPPRMFAQQIAALQRTVDLHEDIASPQAIRDYFDALMFMRGDDFMDQKKIVAMSDQLAFADIERAFTLIDSQTIPIYIPTRENQADLLRLRSGDVSRDLLRRLGRSAVNVYAQHFDLLRKAGALSCPEDGAYAILADVRQYDERRGLALEPECGELWFA